MMRIEMSRLKPRPPNESETQFAMFATCENGLRQSISHHQNSFQSARFSSIMLLQRGHGGCAVEAVPRLGSCETLVDVLYVSDAGVSKPILESLNALFGVNRNAFFPGGAAAQHAGEIGVGFGSELERFVESVIAHASGKVDERLLGEGCGAQEVLFGFFARVGCFAFGG